MKSSRRWLALSCAIVAAALFALAVQGSPWWRIGDEVGIGTMSTRLCGGGACRQSSLGWAGGSETWVSAGGATYAAGLLAALILLALAGSHAARSSGRLLAKSAAVATVTAAVVAVVFFVTRPDVPGTTVARGGPLFALAVVLALVAVTITLWRRGPQADAPMV